MEKSTSQLIKIGLGGGCHWCTEAVFLSLKGVSKVEQGFIASNGNNSSFSEAIIVHFNPTDIPLKVLVEIHLHTHNSTSDHSFRNKYRSAIYTFSENQKAQATLIIDELQSKFGNKIVTKVFDFVDFKDSETDFKNYYYKNPDKPFCESYINPKLKLLLVNFAKHLQTEKLKHLSPN